jgi:hypothetical protein
MANFPGHVYSRETALRQPMMPLRSRGFAGMGISGFCFFGESLKTANDSRVLLE